MLASVCRKKKSYSFVCVQIPLPSAGIYVVVWLMACLLCSGVCVCGGGGGVTFETSRVER